MVFMATTKLSSREFNQDTTRAKSIVDLLGLPEAAEVEFEPSRMKGDLHQPADLS